MGDAASASFAQPYVFCKAKGEPFKDVNSSFATALKKSGIPHFRYHDLRHTFASWLVMKGVDIRTVQELLGHKDLRMTMRYAHLAPDHMKRAVEILDTPDMDSEAAVLDGHYFDTGGDQNEKQDVACQASHPVIFYLFVVGGRGIEPPTPAV